MIPHVKVHNAWRVVRDMCEARGYTLPEDEFPTADDIAEAWPEFDEEDFGELEYVCMTRDKRPVLVYFSPNAKVGNPIIQNLVKRIEDEEFSLVILVYYVSISTPALALIKQLKVDKKYIQPFSFNEVQFNVTKHELQPVFKVCSAEKKAKVLKMYAVNPSKVPGMKSTDPIARYYGAGKGMLFEVHRPSLTLPGTDAMEISYRVVT